MNFLSRTHSSLRPSECVTFSFIINLIGSGKPKVLTASSTFEHYLYCIAIKSSFKSTYRKFGIRRTIPGNPPRRLKHKWCRDLL